MPEHFVESGIDVERDLAVDAIDLQPIVCRTQAHGNVNHYESIRYQPYGDVGKSPHTGLTEVLIDDIGENEHYRPKQYSGSHVELDREVAPKRDVQWIHTQCFLQ